MTASGPRSATIDQAAALCFRPHSTPAKAQVLLVTSRAGDWAIPKGRIDPGFTPPEAAANEALEEAGVRGQVCREALGWFEYLKVGGWAGRRAVTCRVHVYPMLVEDVLDEWLEAQERRRRWVPASKAAREVTQPGLAAVLREFPAWLRSLRNEEKTEG